MTAPMSDMPHLHAELNRLHQRLTTLTLTNELTTSEAAAADQLRIEIDQYLARYATASARAGLERLREMLG